MNFSELLSTAWDAYKERILNPLVGSYMLFWLIINHEPCLLLVFGERPFSIRMSDFEAQIAHWQSFVVPLGLAAIFLIVNPWISVAAHWIKNKPTTIYKQRVLISESAMVQARIARVKATAGLNEAEALEEWDLKVKISERERKIQENQDQTRSRELDARAEKLEKRESALDADEQRFQKSKDKMKEQEQSLQAREQALQKSQEELKKISFRTHRLGRQ